ncbi:MAG TPA: 50S ribosomal protein L25 [Holophagaceae bacterium]|nr:50S ribosomal protein L25 [Holophagaceae bacterium]
MSEETIVVSKRETLGKAASKQLRKNGMIPAVVYGLGEPPVAVAISPKIAAKIIASDSGLNSVIYMQREGTDIKRHVVIKEVQRHAVTGRLRHIDFLRVDPTHKIRVKVPVKIVGVPYGVKTQGGMLDFVHRHIEIECLPNLIPAHIDVNVEALKVGDSVRFDQLGLAATLSILGDAHEVVCAVHAKAAEEEAPAVEGAVAPAEPEVVAAKGKKEEKK